MTKKDYVAIARAMTELRELGPFQTREQFDAHELTCERLADVMEADNSRFDRERFLDACGIPGHVTKKTPRARRKVEGEKFPIDLVEVAHNVLVGGRK